MPRHTRSLPQTTRCFGSGASAGLLAEGLEAAGARVGVYRRRDARLEGSLEISRRFPPNVFKWYGATLVIAANYAGRPGQSRGRPPLSFRTIQVCLQDLLAILGQVERSPSEDIKCLPTEHEQPPPHLRRLKRRLKRQRRSPRNSLRSVRPSRMPRSLSLCELTETFLITFKTPGRVGKRGSMKRCER